MDYSTKRLEALADGIFAIAMTILVVTLDIPHLSAGVSIADASTFLLGQAHKIMNYFLSFVLLAIFWLQHHQHSHITEKTDNVHLWINMFILMFISLIPFSTSLVSTFTYDRVDEALFGLNIFVIGLLFYASLYYAGSRGCLSKTRPVTEKTLSNLKYNAMITPAVASIGIFFAVLTPYYSPYVYLLIPALVMLNSIKKRRSIDKQS